MNLNKKILQTLKYPKLLAQFSIAICLLYMLYRCTKYYLIFSWKKNLYWSELFVPAPKHYINYYWARIPKSIIMYFFLIIDNNVEIFKNVISSIMLVVGVSEIVVWTSAVTQLIICNEFGSFSVFRELTNWSELTVS